MSGGFFFLIFRFCLFSGGGGAQVSNPDVEGCPYFYEHHLDIEAEMGVKNRNKRKGDREGSYNLQMEHKS